MRILLLVTTHFPAYHQSFLETCWPPATRKSTRMAPALRLRVHTDFAAWRPKKIQKGAFAIHPQVSEAFCGVGGRRYTSSICNPERAATRSFQSILRSGRYALLQNKGGPCRIGGPQSAIVHQHGYVAHCVRDLARNASYDAPRRLASVG